MSLLSNLPINRIGMIMCICMLWVYWLFMYSNAAYLHGVAYAFTMKPCVHSGSLQRIRFSVDGISHVHNLYWSPTSHTTGSRIKSSSKAVRKSKSSPSKYSSLLYAAIFCCSSRCVFPTMHFASPMSLSFGSEIYELCAPGGGLRGLW